MIAPLSQCFPFFRMSTITAILEADADGTLHRHTAGLQVINPFDGR